MKRVTDQPSYVLRRLDYGDTSLLVDIFSRDYGRLRLVAKGAKSGKAPRSRLLQPFCELTLGWSGRTELKTLSQLDAGMGLHFGKDAFPCAFYLNELLWNFLEVFDPHEALFNKYAETLRALAGSSAVEPLLRDFELSLLQDIGYGLCLDIEAETGEPVEPQQAYVFQLERGLVASTNPSEGVPGELFLAVQDRDFSRAEVLKLAKGLARQIIHERLEGRELNSRKWFSGGASHRGMPDA